MGYENAIKRVRSAHVAVAVIMLAVSVAIFAVVLIQPSAAFALPLFSDWNGTLALLLTVPTTWALFAATFISFIHHLYYATGSRWKRYVQRNLECDAQFKHRMARHVNPARWCLYGVWGTLLLWALAQQVGVVNIFLLIGLLMLHVLLQRSAYVMEMANLYARNTDNINFYPLFFGLLSFGVIWATVLAYLFATAPAWWIYVAAISGFLISCGFGVVAVMRYARFSKTWQRSLNIEIAYIVLEILLTAVIVVPILIGAFV